MVGRNVLFPGRDDPRAAEGVSPIAYQHASAAEAVRHLAKIRWQEEDFLWRRLASPRRATRRNIPRTCRMTAMTMKRFPRRLPTLSDVAAKAGVSAKTVSRVLNGSAHVAPITRDRVLRAVEALGYRPNAVARALVTGRSGVFGVVIADVENPFFSTVVRGAEDAAATCGQMVIVCNTDERPDRELRAIGLLVERQVDALIVAASRLASRYLTEVARHGTPVVVINRVLRGARVASLVTDDDAAMRSVVVHLHNGGYMHLGYVGGPRSSFANRVWARAFRKYLQQFFPSEPVRIVSGFPPTPEGGRAGVRQLLKIWPEVDAVCTYNDLMAVGALEALRELGLSVPNRIGLVGYDGIPMTEMTQPPLTTVRQSAYELGTQAVAVARRLMDDALPREESVVTLRATLVVRGSTRA